MMENDCHDNRKNSAIISALVCALFLLWSGSATGAAQPEQRNNMEYLLASPDSALLSPNGGKLDVTRELPVKKGDGGSYVEFVMPADALHPAISAKDHTIVRWSATPVLLEGSSSLSRHRENVEKERMSLAAQLETVKARLSVWQATPEQAGDLTQRQNLMETNMPALAREKETLQKRLNLVERELASIPMSPGLGQMVRVDLAGDIESGRKVLVNYSYDFMGCGWHPVYSFNARPDEGNGDVIETRLLAEIWQYTGIDWKDTKITLASRGNGPREPAPLKEWVIDSAASQPRPQPKANARGAQARMLSAAAATDEAAPAPMAAVEGNTEDIYATWTLSAKGLPDGRSRLEITNDAWKAPLQWLARPSRGDSRVWLLAKYKLPADKAWPSGTAEYSVSGQNVGEGSFTPKGGEATLYFGADPRVNVRTTNDTKKHGESGFITASKTWSWGWTYTITNEHNKNITVKVERPEPVIVDDGVTVTYNDKPESKKNSREHMLYWEENVPAHGQAVIQHGVTISSPIKLPLLPDVP